MNPVQYKNLCDLITLYGSAQFWRGANPNNKEAYQRLTNHSEKYYRQILDILVNCKQNE